MWVYGYPTCNSWLSFLPIILVLSLDCLLRLWTWDKSTAKSVLGCIVTVNRVTDPLLPPNQRHTHTRFKLRLQAVCDRQPSSRWGSNSWYIMTDRVTDRSLSIVPISHDGLTTSFLWSGRKQQSTGRGKMKFKWNESEEVQSKFKVCHQAQNTRSAEIFTLHRTFTQRLR